MKNKKMSALFLGFLFSGLGIGIYLAAHMLTHSGHFYLNVFFVAAYAFIIGLLVSKLMNK